MTNTRPLNKLIEQLHEVKPQLSEAARPLGQLSNFDVVQRKRFGDEIMVRAYRPADRPVVRGLHRNAQGYGHVGTDCETVLNAMTDVAKPSRHHVWVTEAEGQVIAAKPPHDPRSWADTTAGFDSPDDRRGTTQA